jgi:hypothetical protein
VAEILTVEQVRANLTTLAGDSAPDSVNVWGEPIVRSHAALRAALDAANGRAVEATLREERLATRATRAEADLAATTEQAMKAEELLSMSCHRKMEADLAAMTADRDHETRRFLVLEDALIAAIPFYGPSVARGENPVDVIRSAMKVLKDSSDAALASQPVEPATTGATPAPDELERPSKCARCPLNDGSECGEADQCAADIAEHALAAERARKVTS